MAITPQPQPDDGRSARSGDTLVRGRNRRVADGLLVAVFVAVEVAWVATLVAALVWLIVG